MNRVISRTCIITGAALGIGRGCAIRLAEEGANVALFDVLDEPGRGLAAELGDATRFVHLDVTDREQWKALARQLTGLGLLEPVPEGRGGLRVGPEELVKPVLRGEQRPAIRPEQMRTACSVGGTRLLPVPGATAVQQRPEPVRR